MSKRGGFLEPFFARFRTKAASPTGTEGVGGTGVYGGYIDQKEQDASLSGVERYRTFSNILVNTSIVAAAVRLYLNMVGKARWRFEPVSGDDVNEDDALEHAERIEHILTKDMTTPWGRVVRRASMYRFHGFSIQEWTGKREDDGTIGLLDVEPRPQLTIERWDLDETGTVFGVFQRSPQDAREIYLPRAKLLYLVDDALNDSPEGLGLFRHIVEAQRRLRRYEQLEGFAYETDLRGIPVGRAPIEDLNKQVRAGTITEQDKTNYIAGLKTFLEKHIKNPALALLLDSATYKTTDEKGTPSTTPQWDLQLLNGGATAHEAVAKAIERLNREIARVLGVEQLLLGERGGGSLALAESKANTLAMIVDSALEEIEEAVQSDLVARLYEVNGWDEELMPTAKTEKLQHRTITEITQALRDLSNASTAIGPEDEAFGEVFDQLGLTRPVFDEMSRARDEALLAAGGIPGGPNIPPQPGQPPGAPEPAPATPDDDDTPDTEEDDKGATS